MMTGNIFKILVIVICAAGYTGVSYAADEDRAKDQAMDAKNPYALFEGRDEELSRAMAVVMKTFQSRAAYDHQINDALVKATMTSLQFAKNNDMMEEFVQHDVETLRPILVRRSKEIQETGNREIALDSLAETGCFYQLVVDGYEREPGKVTYTSPYKRVLAASSRLGQHDLTEQEIHEKWTKPRFEAYAEILGVDLEVSDWSEDGVITVRLVPMS